MARRFLVTIKSSISALKVHSEPTMMIWWRNVCLYEKALMSSDPWISISGVICSFLLVSRLCLLNWQHLH